MAHNESSQGVNSMVGTQVVKSGIVIINASNLIQNASGLAQMLKGGVIMDVVNVEHAR
jgi:hypothetical protein